MKRIYIILDNETYQRLQKLKQRLKLTWEQLLIRGAECLEEESGG